MKTTKLNVFEEQRKFMEQHRNADHTVHDAQGIMIQAVYVSPMGKWKGRIAPDGTVDVPDMDYYNSLNDPAEISKAIDEIFPSNKEGKRP